MQQSDRKREREREIRKREREEKRESEPLRNIYFTRWSKFTCVPRLEISLSM
jgi:hypothetical protein